MPSLEVDVWPSGEGAPGHPGRATFKLHASAEHGAAPAVQVTGILLPAAAPSQSSPLRPLRECTSR